MTWAADVDDLEQAIPCGGSVHVVRWHHGEVLLDQHPDIDAERALVAFGGEAPPCLEHYELWCDAVADGGFLGEWAHLHQIGRDRLWWLRVALDRMRAEGVQEFLRDMPRSTASRMGQFLTAFPQPFLDQAAAEVADRLRTGVGVGYHRAGLLVEEAVALRVREAFARSVGGSHLSLGAAALVPFRPVIIDDSRPAVDGHLDGRNSRVEVVVPTRWLAGVWARGAAVVEGRLVLDVDDESNVATTVVWGGSGSGGFVPRLEQRRLARVPGGWALRDLGDT